MLSFPRILFPVDLSDQSRHAAPFVKALATRFHSELTLLHVLDQVPFSAWVDLPGLTEARRSELSTFLAQELGGMHVEPCIEAGDPATTIARHAIQKKISLIAMPTHGYGPVRSILLGSVTAKVLHDAECPVWTASHPENLAVEPGAKWHRILCAIGSDSTTDFPLLHWAAQFAAEQNVNLRLVHAVSGFDEPKDNWPDDPLRDFLFNVARERIADLQHQAGTKFHLNIEAGRAGPIVRKLALDHRADLVVIGRGIIQKRFSRLLSNAYAIVRDAPCPVISV